MIHPFIWNKHYTPFEVLLSPNAHGTRVSEAFYCGHCGEVWCRLLNDQFPNDWQFYRVDCERCPGSPYGSRIPGSLFLIWDKPLREALPNDLLRREVLLLADHVKKFPNFSY